MFLIKKIYGWFLIIFALLLIGASIFFRVCISKDAVDITQKLSNIKLGFLIFFCLIQGVIMVVTIMLIVYKKRLKLFQKSKIILWLALLLNEIYWKPLEALHIKLAPHLPGSGKFFLLIASYLEKGNINFRYKCYHNCFFLLSFVPQILVSVIFLYEIVIYQQLKIFLYTLPLLLLPPVFQIYLKLCISFSERNTPQFYTFLNIVGSNKDHMGNYLTWTYSFKPEYSNNSQELLKEKVRYFELIHKIKLHVENIKYNKSQYDKYVLSITSSMFFIGSCIRLIHIL